MATYNIQDQGADSTGTNPIDPELDPLIEDDATIVFPPGDYLLNSLQVPSGTTNVTIQGEPGATLIPKDYGSNSTSPWFIINGDGFGWHQFEINVNGRNPGGVEVQADDWEITRLVTQGEVHAETDGQAPGDSGVARSWFNLYVLSDYGTGLVEDCYFHHGSNSSVSEGSNRRAILVDGGRGELTINRCWFEQWGENTIYAKQPYGKVRVFNSFWRNTQNGLRIGGRTTVNNCVSIKDDYQPYNWASSALQVGVNYDADVSPQTDDRNAYDGLAVVRESDFYHDFRTPSGTVDSCGAAIGGSDTPERAEIIDCRVYYNSSRSHDAVYNGNGAGPNRYWSLENLHIDNDCAGSQYCIDVGYTPDEWGEVSGVYSAENGQLSNSSHVRNNMETGTPEQPDTRPPLPQPPGSGEQPMEDATIVRIDNSGNDTSSSYSFSGSGSGGDVDTATIHPSGKGDSEINQRWNEGHAGRQVDVAQGTVEAGQVHSYYIAQGSFDMESWEQTGDASLTIVGTTTNVGPTASTWTNSSWQEIDDGDITAGASLSQAALKFWDETNGEWKTAVEKN